MLVVFAHLCSVYEIEIIGGIFEQLSNLDTFFCTYSFDDSPDIQNL